MKTQPLGDHPKLRKLCRVLKIERPLAVGILHYFWWECYKNRTIGPDGKLPDCWDAEVIASAANWKGNPEIFVEALIKCKFVDRGTGGTLAVHNYAERAPHKTKKRWSRHIERQGSLLGIDPVTPATKKRRNTSPKKAAGTRASFKVIIKTQSEAIYK